MVKSKEFEEDNKVEEEEVNNLSLLSSGIDPKVLGESSVCS